MPARTSTVRATCTAALTALAFAAGAAVAAEPCRPGTHSAASDTVTASDGTPIAVTVMRPAAADCGPVPVVLHGHGWAGSRATSPGDSLTYTPASIFLDAGYGLVSIDARGHGESGGTVRLMQPDAEIADYRTVLDHVHDTLDWVLPEPGTGVPKDVVAGAYGASYGGGWQLTTAATDGRLDAVVPITTWWDLPEALLPDGVLRTDWAAALVAAGEVNARLDPRISQWVVETMLFNAAPPAALEHLRRASPARWAQDVQVPTLLVQGLPDTLFTFDQAVAAFETLEGAGAPVSLLGVNTGHVLPVLQPTGIGAPARTGTDGCVTDVAGYVLDHFDAHLRDDISARQRLAAVPTVALPTEQGRCVTGPGWPVADTSRTVQLGDVVALHAAGTVLVEVLAPPEDVTIAGAPVLRATLAPPLPEAPDGALFVSLVLADKEGLHIVDDQVTPIRTVGAAGAAIEVPMTSIATTVPADGRLLLRVDGLNEQFLASGARLPGLTALLDASLTLPVVTSGTVGPTDTSRASGAAPAAGQVASDGRTIQPRPDSGDPRPDPADAAPDGGAMGAVDDPLPATGGGAAAAVLLVALAAVPRWTGRHHRR